MKFAEHLGAHITPEWRKQYIQYEEMKAMLYKALELAPSAEVVEEEVLARYFARFDEAFFTFCTKELTKINTFYSEKLAEATRKFVTLKSELEGSEGDLLFFLALAPFLGLVFGLILDLSRLFSSPCRSQLNF